MAAAGKLKMSPVESNDSICISLNGQAKNMMIVGIDGWFDAVLKERHFRSRCYQCLYKALDLQLRQS